MTAALSDRERYNPGPHPDDSSYHAFCEEYECRYDVMPGWWWDSDRRDAVYLQWQRGKENEAEAKAQSHARAERAQLLNAKRVLDLICEESGDG